MARLRPITMSLPLWVLLELLSLTFICLAKDTTIAAAVGSYHAPHPELNLCKC
ncbi:hypothetical protein WAI453_006334 [Rhynchosporium graminicola]